MNLKQQENFSLKTSRAISHGETGRLHKQNNHGAYLKRSPRAGKDNTMKKKIYIAYGSNLNHEQMAVRCPDAEFLGTSEIKDYTLIFKGGYSGVADIIPHKGGVVPVGIWSISEADEQRLDIYEGFPKLYVKRFLTFKMGNEIMRGMAYVMTADHNVKMPSEQYFNVILQGYLDCGIDTELFFEFVKNTSEIA